jgi:hypothetical protein
MGISRYLDHGPKGVSGAGIEFHWANNILSPPDPAG